MERNAIVFLGLMAIAYNKFDALYSHTDNTQTHTNGLNIFAAIIDNYDGELLGQKQNQIHKECNPMLHAEQLTLHEAIEKLKIKKPRDEKTTSVETYYREYLFNKPNTPNDFTVGATIFTTLEPCPFCTSALLVTRMKRIIYIIPDKDFGGSFDLLKEKFYKKYDINYGQIDLREIPGSELVDFAASQFKTLMNYVNNNPQNATLYLDNLESFLKNCNDYFLNITENDLKTTDEERIRNVKTLSDLQRKVKSYSKQK